MSVGLIEWIESGRDNRITLKAATDFLRLTDHGRDMNRCLAVSFIWDEDHRFTDLIRKRLKHLARSPPKEPASRSKTSSATSISRSFSPRVGWRGTLVSAVFAVHALPRTWMNALIQAGCCAMIIGYQLYLWMDGGFKDAVEGRVARACASCRVNSGC